MARRGSKSKIVNSYVKRGRIKGTFAGKHKTHTAGFKKGRKR
jgi:hypothetical protein